MKKLTLGLFIIYITVLLNAQSYYPLPNRNAYWSVKEWNETQFYYDDAIYSVDGDTTISSLIYTKVYRLNDMPTIYDTIKTLHSLMRQDSVAKKIWFIRHYLGETKEKLGYDLSAAIGDTVILPAFDYGNCGDSIFKLDTKYIDLIQIMNGSFRTYYGFNSLVVNGHYIMYIEGISDQRSTIPNKYSIWDPFHQSFTICMHQNNSYTWPYTTIPSDTTNCGFYIVGIYENNKIELRIFPNPAIDFVNISLPVNLLFESLIVTDIMGCRMPVNFTRKTSTQLIADIRGLSNGSYIFSFITSVDSFHKKIIINH